MQPRAVVQRWRRSVDQRAAGGPVVECSAQSSFVLLVSWPSWVLIGGPTHPAACWQAVSPLALLAFWHHVALHDALPDLLQALRDALFSRWVQLGPRFFSSADLPAASAPALAQTHADLTNYLATVLGPLRLEFLPEALANYRKLGDPNSGDSSLS